MDEQREFSLEVVNNPLKAIQGEHLKVRKQMLHLIEQQTPIVWCGGAEGEHHDITICLVPNGFNWKMNEETEYYREILTVLKVHSSRVSRCSKYFETCLTERWTKPSLTFFLETRTDIACYIDCFSRMYKPLFFKDFKDVKHSLRLLKVASQIQFEELMNSTLLYLSSKVWLNSDEVMIRLYSASADFPRKHAQDLSVRLGMDESKEDCHKQTRDAVELCVRTALGHDGNFRSSRALIKECLPDCALSDGPDSGSSVDSNFTRDVVKIVSRAAKDMLVDMGQECDGQAYTSDPRFADKILAICWIVEAMLAARVAEEVVQCFVHLHAFSKVLATHMCKNQNIAVQRIASDAAMQLAQVVLVMYQEVAAGNLLLKTPERVALLENWHSLLKRFLIKDNIDERTKDLFSTLPLNQQMELIKSRFKNGNYEDYINTNSLGQLLKRKWPKVDVKCVVFPPSSSQLAVGVEPGLESLPFHPSEA